MKKTLKKLIAAALAVTMLGCSAGALVACGGGGGKNKKPWEGKEVIPDPGYTVELPPQESPVDDNEYEEGQGETIERVTTTGTPITDYNTGVTATANVKKGTYNTYSSKIPTLWNELDSIDNNDSQIMDYLSSNFFIFDYKFDGDKFNTDGTVNYGAIVDGQYEVKFSAATKLEDVTSDVTGKLAYTEAEKKKGGYAWRLTLRDDLKWDNGDPIKAGDFAYSMEQQLSPEYRFQRASSYYGAVNIKGAQNFAYAGQTVWLGSDSVFGDYDSSHDSDMVFTFGNSKENAAWGGAVCNVRGLLGAPDSMTAEAVLAALGMSDLTSKVNSINGKTYAEIKADATLLANFNELFEGIGGEPGDELLFFVSEGSYPELDYDGNVGVYAEDDTHLVVCYTNSYEFIKDDGSLSYNAAYTLANLPLVHEATFEANRVAPAVGQTLATNTYQTPKAKTASGTVSASAWRSWGPYKLTAYQTDKTYKLEKNPNWYGYSLKDNTNQYNITAIECEQIDGVSTQWQKFLSGEIDDIGIDPTHATDYRNSKYAKITPTTNLFSFHLYSGLEGLQKSGRNNTVLAIDDFRKAISLGIDRVAYVAATTTASSAAYGFLNDMYYYDVENGGVYRQTNEAKAGLLRAYGYTENTDHTWSMPDNPTIQNKTIDEAYQTLSGYNLEMAKEYVEKAYDRLTQYWVYYQYDSSKKIQIKYGTSVDNEDTRRDYNYIRDHVFAPLFEGTSLEGKVELVFDASFGNNWSDKFMAGEYELCTGGWGQAAFNPHYMIGAYIEPSNAFTAGFWDTDKTNMTMTLPGEAGEYPGAGKVRTMSLLNWYNCLNGYDTTNQKYHYDWSAGKIKAEYRNEILAKLEETILLQYYSIPTTTASSASILGAQFSYGADTYNTFLGYGGMRYIKVNYTDSEWATYVSSQGGDLATEYKKTA